MASQGVAWSLVVAQFTLMAAVALAPGTHFDRGPLLLVIGAALVIGGGILAVWAGRWLGKGLTPIPLPNGRVDLVTGGPYRRVRHPMYSAAVMAMAGVAVLRGSWWSVAAWVALVVALSLKARWEERQLRAFFDNYASYQERSGRFLPRMR